MSRGECGEKVEDVDFTCKRGSHVRFARRRFELDGCAAGSQTIAGSAPVALRDAVGEDVGSGFTRGCGELFGTRIVRVDNGDAWSGIAGSIEEETLSSEVVLHCAVVVEMVAREVGEDGDIERDADGAALLESVAWDFRGQLRVAHSA